MRVETAAEHKKVTVRGQPEIIVVSPAFTQRPYATLW